MYRVVCLAVLGIGVLSLCGAEPADEPDSFVVGSWELDRGNVAVHDVGMAYADRERVVINNGAYPTQPSTTSSSPSMPDTEWMDGTRQPTPGRSTSSSTMPSWPEGSPGRPARGSPARRSVNSGVNSGDSILNKPASPRPAASGPASAAAERDRPTAPTPPRTRRSQRAGLSVRVGARHSPRTRPGMGP